MPKIFNVAAVCLPDIHYMVDILHGPIRETDMIEVDKEIEIYAA